MITEGGNNIVMWSCVLISTNLNQIRPKLTNTKIKTSILVCLDQPLEHEIVVPFSNADDHDIMSSMALPESWRITF
jgi:hypothetical protein